MAVCFLLPSCHPSATERLRRADLRLFFPQPRLAKALYMQLVHPLVAESLRNASEAPGWCLMSSAISACASSGGQAGRGTWQRTCGRYSPEERRPTRAYRRGWTPRSGAPWKCALENESVAVAAFLLSSGFMRQAASHWRSPCRSPQTTYTEAARFRTKTESGCSRSARFASRTLPRTGSPKRRR